MRIACLQFAPQVGDVDNNLNRADSVLSKANPQDLDSLDLLVLPEMAFSGYNFESRSQIAPFLEHAGSGISSLWARTNALKLDCNVVVGYPEKEDNGGSPQYYNSAIMVNSEGDTIANYRKSHLYYTDERWALEGRDGFFTGYVPCLGYTAMGICMDLNPYRFEAPWHAYEFAFHVLDVEANVVILSMAWLTNESPGSFSRLPQEPDVETLTYWVQRLEPLIRAEQDEEIIVIFCNRAGIEGDAVYAGTSAVLGIYHGEVNLYGILGRGVKELLIVDTSEKPKAKLVNGPDAQPLSEIPMRRLISPIDSNTITEASPGKELSPGSPGKSNPNADTPHSAAPGGWSAIGSTPVSAGATPTSSNSNKSQRVKPPSIRIPVATSLWRELPKEVIHEDQEDSGAHTPTGPSPTPLELRPDGGSQNPPEWLWTPSSAIASSPLKLRSATPRSGMRARTKSTFGLVTPDTPSIQKPLSTGKSTNSTSIWQELAVALCTPPEDNFVPGITDTPGIMDMPGMNFPPLPSGKSTNNVSSHSRTSSRKRSTSINEGSLHHPPMPSDLRRSKDRATGIEQASLISPPMWTDPIPRRPSSPESRNVSRSRLGGRSDSVEPILSKSEKSMTPMQRLEALISRADAEKNGDVVDPLAAEKRRDGSHRRHRSQEARHRSRKEDFSSPKSAFLRSDAPGPSLPFPLLSRSGLCRLDSPSGAFIPLIASPSIFSNTSAAMSEASLKNSTQSQSHRTESCRSEASRSGTARPEDQQLSSRTSKRGERGREVKPSPVVDEQRHRRDRSLSVAETVRASSRHQTSSSRPTQTVIRAPKDVSATIATIPPEKPLPAMPIAKSSQSRAVSRGRQHPTSHNPADGASHHQDHYSQQHTVTHNQQQLVDDRPPRKARKHHRSASMGESSSHTPPDMAPQNRVRPRSRPTQTLQLGAAASADDIIATVGRIRHDCPVHRQKRSRSSNGNANANENSISSSSGGDIYNISLRVQLPADFADPGVSVRNHQRGRRDTNGAISRSLGMSTMRSGRSGTGEPPFEPKALHPPGAGFGAGQMSEVALDKFALAKPTTPVGRLRDLEIACEIRRPRSADVMMR